MYKILLTNIILLLHSKKTKVGRGKKASNQQTTCRGILEKKIHKQKEMREKLNLMFLADKSSISVQQGGNLDVAYGNQMKGLLVYCNRQAGNAGVLHQAVHTAAAEGTFQAGSACRLTSITLPENPIFPLPNMAPMRSQHKDSREQGSGAACTARGKCRAHSSSPLLRESRHIHQAPGWEAHWTHPHSTGHTAPLNSLTSYLHVSIHTKTRKRLGSQNTSAWQHYTNHTGRNENLIISNTFFKNKGLC